MTPKAETRTNLIFVTIEALSELDGTDKSDGWDPALLIVAVFSLDDFFFGTKTARADNVALGSNTGNFKGLTAGGVGSAAVPKENSNFLEPLNCFDLLK